MITDKIKALFSFIEFLHSNIEYFKQFDNEINALYLLEEERNKLTPRSNFIDKLKYDEVQAKFKNKSNIINENIIQVIQAKAIELNICDLNKLETLMNWNSSEIYNLKENFSKNDIPEILLHKNKYLEFKTKTNFTYFQSLFFSNLDEILIKELFDFFKESTENEFESFETKTTHVDTIREGLELFQKGHKKFSFPTDSFLNPSKIQQSYNKPLPSPKTEKDEALNWFNCIVKVLVNELYPHIKEQINENIDTLIEAFKHKNNKSVWDAVERMVIECHRMELDIISEIPVNVIRNLLFITKNDLIRHELENGYEESLGNRILKTRIKQLELVIEKSEIKPVQPQQNNYIQFKNKQQAVLYYIFGEQVGKVTPLFDIQLNYENKNIKKCYLQAEEAAKLIGSVYKGKSFYITYNEFKPLIEKLAFPNPNYKETQREHDLLQLINNLTGKDPLNQVLRKINEYIAKRDIAKS